MALTTVFAASASPKRVMILNPFGRDTEPFTAAVSAFRATMGREIGESVAFDGIPLDLAHFSEADGKEPLVTFLAERIRRHPVDLVVPVGGASVGFVDRHRELLFADTPILVVAAEPRLISNGLLASNATLVTQEIDLPGMVEDMLQMQPDTKQIAVVFGSSALEKLWMEECRRDFQSFAGRVEFVWLNDLPFEDMLNRCAQLPPGIPFAQAAQATPSAPCRRHFPRLRSCSDSTPKPPPAPVTDTQPVGEGLKVIGFALLGAAVVGVLGRILSKS
jgi:hypothetical protein